MKTEAEQMSPLYEWIVETARSEAAAKTNRETGPDSTTLRPALPALDAASRLTLY